MKIWLVVLTVAVIVLAYWIQYEDVQEIVNFTYAANVTLQKPYEAHQMALKVTPDGSAYIPIIFKDEVTSNKYFKKSEKQWLDEDFEKGSYYAIEKLFMPYEYKR